jgi:hypothetical protein
MKRIFVGLVFIISANTYGATLNLQPGESTTIQANTATTVSCGAGSADSCKSKVDVLGKLIDTCPWNSRYRLRDADCLKEVTAKWKNSNRACASEGTMLCIEKCGKRESCYKYCQ